MPRVRDYCIMSIDDSRASFKDAMHEILDEEWRYYALECVDGRDKRALAKYFNNNSFVHFDGWTPRYGEAGFWASLLNAMMLTIEIDRPLAILEDDAIMDERFVELLDRYLAECGEIDAFHLLTWFDRKNFRSPQLDPADYDGQLVTANWHDFPFGGAVMFPSGARKIVDHLHEHPITTVGDVWLYQAEQRGVLNAMAPAPYQPSPLAPRFGPTRSLIDRTLPVHPSILPRRPR